MSTQPREAPPSVPTGTVTFLFTDIEGSTKLLERLGDAYVSVLADHRDLLRAAIAHHQGHEIDTQGDAFFVAFPRALDAVRCVSEAQQALAAHAWPSGVQVRVRMGLHTGEPLVAQTGYVGLDVHRAARIAAAAHGGQVLLSQTTRDLIAADLPPGAALRSLGRHQLKDIREAQPLYQLEIAGLPASFPPLRAQRAAGDDAIRPDHFTDFGQLLSFLRQRAGLTKRALAAAVDSSETHLSRMAQNQRVPDQATLAARFVPALYLEHEPAWAQRLLDLAAAARQSTAPRGRPPALAEASLLDRIVGGRLVGRQSELAELRQLWERAQQGQAHLALLSGEPGVGKTRLTRELQAQARQAGAVVLNGGCYEFEAVTPYLPFVEALRAWVDAQGPATLRAALGPAAPEVARLVPEIEIRLGPLTPNAPLAPNEERLRLFDQLARFFQELAAPHGLLLVLDDLHWADQATVALLHYLLRRLREARVLVLAAYRETELDRLHPLAAALVDWNRERLATRVALGRLTEPETGALLAALFGQAQVSGELAAAIHRETEGNPFFIEEVVKALIEQGAIYRQGDAWERKTLAELSLPQSIKDAIGRRLNRLSAGCLEVLHLAAMLGKVFPFSELAAMASGSEDQVLDALDEAAAAQLVRPESGEAFAFTHDKIRETLYAELNPIRRRRLHQRLGERLEALYAAPAARDAHLPDLAHHYLHSGDLTKGLAYATEAGAQAQRLFALEAAAGYYQQALECAEALNQPEQVTALHERLGEVHEQRGVHREAAEAFQRALNGGAALDTAQRAVLQMKIGNAFAQIGDARGLEYLQAAEQALDPTTHPNALAQTLTQVGRFHHYQGQERLALGYFERARALAEPLDQPETLTTIYYCLAGGYQNLPDYALSDAWGRRCIALGERHHYPFATATGHEFLAENASTRGLWAAALEHALADRQIGERIGALDRVAWADMSCTEVYLGRGDLAQAEATAQAALTLAESIGEDRVAVLLGGQMVRAKTDLGQLAAARAAGEHWCARADAMGQLFLQTATRKGLAYCCGQQAEWAAAAGLYAECAALFAKADSRSAPLFLGPESALAYLALGQLEAAAAFITDYLALARAVEAPHRVGCALRVLGQVLVAQGRMAEAQAAFDEAVTCLERAGSRLEAGRARLARGQFARAQGAAEAAQQDGQQARALFAACGAVGDEAQAAEFISAS